jgi:hypothetical protein
MKPATYICWYVALLTTVYNSFMFNIPCIMDKFIKK